MDMDKKPNIVIFNPDSYRGDVLGHLGNSGAVTPNLDAMLGRGGVSFTHAFAQNPYCTPSRCSFMTGWYPHVHGYRSMKNMLKETDPNLFSVLRRAGYHVWWGGKNDLFAVEKPEDYLKHCDTKYRADKPFREYHVPEPVSKDDPRYTCFYRGIATRNGDGALWTDSDRGNTQGAVDFISASGEEPFCIYLPLNTPHPAYFVEDDFYNLIDPDRLPPRLPLPERTLPMLDALRDVQRSSELDEAAWQDIKRVYYAMCTKIDFLFGQVVDALEKKGIYDDTLILFLSDHGDYAGDYNMVEKTGGSLEDALIRSPLIIKPHAALGASAGTRTHLTELVDMTATLYDLLDLDPGYDCQGKSLRASLMGDNSEIRDAVFAEAGARAGEEHFINIDCVDMPADSFYGSRFHAVVPYHREGTYAVSVRTHTHKYIHRPYNSRHALFDLRKDPGECNNVSGSSEYADVEQTLRMRLLHYFMTTGDVMPYKQDSRHV